MEICWLDQHGVNINRLLRWLGNRLLLALLILGEGPEPRDDLSLLASADRLGATLEQVQRLALLFYGHRDRMKYLGKDKNLLERNGIDLSSLAQNSVMAMAWV